VVAEVIDEDGTTRSQQITARLEELRP